MRKQDPNKCPQCNGFLMSDSNKIKCLSCKFETDAKRKEDKDLPGLKEIKDTWH